MYVRELKSKNGKTYVQVVDKSSGKYKVVKNVVNRKVQLFQIEDSISES